MRGLVERVTGWRIPPMVFDPGWFIEPCRPVWSAGEVLVVGGEGLVKGVAVDDFEAAQVLGERARETAGPVVERDGALAVTGALGDVGRESFGGDQSFEVIGVEHDPHCTGGCRTGRRMAYWRRQPRSGSASCPRGSVVLRSPSPATTPRRDILHSIPASSKAFVSEVAATLV